MIDRSTPPLKSLYKEVILEHYRRPRNKRELEAPDVEIHMQNPVCGDEIKLQLRVRGGAIEEVAFTGQGCSISQAASSMMTQRLQGRSLAEADALAARFTEMLRGDQQAARDKELGDLRTLAGVANFPVRVKCAMLVWEAFREAEKKLAAR
ncbi:MAG: Fe-S cluster assembly sulfur transfer protein SufU [Longimicrobiaceae bacterium]